jgi:ribosomal protein S18 acetylase RimI-like enzyme
LHQNTKRAFLQESCTLFPSVDLSNADRFNQGWVEAYKKLAEADMHHEAMVAITNQGEQVAWSLMCSPKATPVIKDFAFLPLMPSKEKTGLIACVGVVPHARGKGIASALLTHALEHMRIKHVEGVFIDWVTIRGLYEKSGFQQVFEYEDYVWGGRLDGQPEPDREVSEPDSPEMKTEDIQCWS